MTPFAATPTMSILAETEHRDCEKYLVIYSFYVSGEAKVLVLWTTGENKKRVMVDAWDLYERSFPDCKGHICRTLVILREDEIRSIDSLKEIINLTI